MSFAVVDALGWCSLARRSGDLDGSIPLRAARACAPLLDGNAFGWQLRWDAATTLVRRRGHWQLLDDTMVRSARACAPYLAAHGLAPPWWCEALADGPVIELGRGPLARLRKPALGLWTGLLVRATPAGPLLCLDAGNRRSRAFVVHEHVIEERERWIPLLLELQPRDDGDSLALGGELATLAAIAPGPARRLATLAEHPRLAQAHLDFYDAQYFASKREGPTRKYRRMIAAPVEADADAVTDAVAALAGDAAVEIEAIARRHGADGVHDGGSSTPLLRFACRNAVGFRARFDGLRVHVEPDAAALARHAEAITARWQPLLRDDGEDHRGALWYLGKYFTPHVDGEPHMFVKPAALFATPPGWATLVQGPRWLGAEILRGSIHTDRFHAAPAVFGFELGARFELAAGAPLSWLLPYDPAVARAAPEHAPPLPTAARGPEARA
ncbi:MAG: hypothetical protein K1X88_07985 [Nannocystaceae bacterium]|nr:hypothetical protein [Nannocystaceae bacterium]